jgi:hypothetical protein
MESRSVEDRFVKVAVRSLESLSNSSSRRCAVCLQVIVFVLFRRFSWCLLGAFITILHELPAYVFLVPRIR